VRETRPGRRAGRRAAVAVVLLLGFIPAVSPASASAALDNSDIYVENFNGMARKAVLSWPSHEDHPSWSPGGRIAFDSNRDGDFDIYVVNSDGGKVVQFDGEGDDLQPAFSPDGRRFAFASHRADGTNIWVVNEDGSNLRRLTLGGQGDLGPAWSPDGHRIAFSRQIGIEINVWVVNDDGTGLTQLSHGNLDVDPDWSPDGTRIAFGAGDGGVKTMNPDGSDVRMLATGAEPAWAPGGARIVYIHFDPKTHDGKLWRVAPDGSNDQPLGDQAGNVGNPAWKAGGGQIAFTVHH